VREPLKQTWALAHTASAFNLIGWAYARMGEVDLGLPFARRAVAEEPGCWECLDTLALLLADTGFYEDALPLQERAVALMPEGRREPDVLKRLDRYRAALKRRTAESTANGK
jgi:hypothetical protein